MKFSGKKICLIAVFILSFFFATNFCSAALLKNSAAIKTQVDASAGSYDTNIKIYTLAQTLINAFLSLVGVILLAYLLYSGYNWMTARGDEEKVTKAKDTITRAIIGVIIIVAAYAISIFVMGKLQQGILGNGTATSATTPITPVP